jgi:hypothetical protein
MVRVTLGVEKFAALFGVRNETASDRTVWTDGSGLFGFEDL